MRTVTSGLVTLEIKLLKYHPLILILKYEKCAIVDAFKFNQLAGLWTPIISQCWTLLQSTYHCWLLIHCVGHRWFGDELFVFWTICCITGAYAWL